MYCLDVVWLALNEIKTKSKIGCSKIRKLLLIELPKIEYLVVKSNTLILTYFIQNSNCYSFLSRTLKNNVDFLEKFQIIKI